jgi:hypothetical protein
MWKLALCKFGESIFLKILKPLLRSLEHEFLFFKKNQGESYMLFKNPYPAILRKNQRTTQQWKKPNKKQKTPQGIHTHLLRSPISLLIRIVMTSSSWCSFEVAQEFCCTLLTDSLAVQCVCTSQGEEFQTHRKRKKIEMELCCCTVASGCYTLFVSNNKYYFFCWLHSFWCYFSVCH